MNRYLARVYRAYASFRKGILQNEICAILARPEPPDCSASEAAFDRLQAEGSGVPDYGYDPVSTWKRGVDRATGLLTLSARLKSPGARILEAGCGDGMTGYLLAGFGHEVTLADADDWRDARARLLPLVKGDLAHAGLLKEHHFDLICSYNSFEHFADPAAVLRQLLLACQPGGLLYLEFGPLYCGPWGLHAYRTLYMPYPQFLFSEQFLSRKLESLGIEDLGSRRTSLQHLNRWRAAQFRELWNRSGCELLRCHVNLLDVQYLRMVKSFPKAFRGRGLTLEDLLTQSLSVLLRRPTRGERSSRDVG